MVCKMQKIVSFLKSKIKEDKRLSKCPKLNYFLSVAFFLGTVTADKFIPAVCD